MAIPTRLIKRRIKSIRSTGKIMKAMELVAASKMRRATQLALGTRPYSQLIGELTERVRRLVDSTQHPLLGGHRLRVTGHRSQVTGYRLHCFCWWLLIVDCVGGLTVRL
ncbi:MAG: FoF1 ATP synthase subunit gamma [Candidatus Uhrbacteria bacterium]|nr:FoF1 ATP synthase subunit gamma [Candidatus Uhrbacteria bacterium]